MLTEKQSPAATKSAFKNPFVYTTLAIAVVAIYVGWILVSRHMANRAYEDRVRNQQTQKQHESDQAAIEQLGGSQLAIQMLYATPQIHRGETAQVCFGVANAKSVTLQPQSDPVWPSHNLCVHVNPKKTTAYTLIATGADGKSVTQQVTVTVR
jgi:hypothetical protein